MANYEVPPAVLIPYLPPGTELDFKEGKTYVSIVGFRFLDTRLLGIPVPLHQNFTEVNLRFYVRRQTPRWMEARHGIYQRNRAQTRYCVGSQRYLQRALFIRSDALQHTTRCHALAGGIPVEERRVELHPSFR